MSDYSVTLSTTEPNNYVGLIKLRQGDVASQSIQATITANGQLFKFDRLSVFFNAVLPNGNVIRDKVTEVDYVNSKLNYVVADSFLQEVAQVTAWFSFENGDKIIDSTKNFQYSVIAGWKECIPQGNYIYELSEIQRQIEEIIGNKDFSSLLNKISLLETNISYLDNTKADKDEMNVKIKLLNDLKADKTLVDARFASIVSGAPKGTFTTLNALKEAYPKGTEGVFLVLENGHWYYYTDGWLDGGVYQATVDSNRTRTASIVSKKAFNVNQKTMQLEFDNSYLAIEDGFLQYDMSKYQGSTFQLSETGHLFYDTITNELKTTSKASEALDSDLSLGWFFIPNEMYDLRGKYTVDGYINTARYTVRHNQRTKIGEWAFITCSKDININTKNRTLEFPVATNIALTYGLSTVNLADTYSGKSFNISPGGANAGWLYVDPFAKKLLTDKDTTELNENCFLLGVFWWDVNKFWFSFDYTINSAKPSEMLQGRYGKTKTMNCLGDSLTKGIKSGDEVVNGYPYFLPFYTGLQCFNYGVGGTFVQKTSGRTDSFVERIQALPPSDFLMLFGGMNDYRGSLPLGKVADVDTALENLNVETFTGGLEFCINYWLDHNIDSNIFLCTIPLQKKDENHSFVPNKIGLMQKDYNDKIVELSKKYSLPLIDMWQLGISPFNAKQGNRWMGDLMHYREGGYEKMAQYMAGEIKRHIY